MKNRRVRFTATAQEHVRRKKAWWLANRDQTDVFTEELEQALRDVKVLRRLIPICANCKRVRTDAGDWQQLEEYIQDHSEVEFSHGVCQVCMRQVYPDVFKD